MGSSPTSFRDSEEFKRGRTGEKKIATMLQRRGWFIIPSYDYSGEDKNKAPKMQGTAAQYVIPDLDAAKEGKRMWAEVKTKAKADWTRITKRLEHGISRKHWQHYHDIQRITGCPVWLFIVEESTGAVLFEQIDVLGKCVRIYEGEKMGWAGMAYFPRDAFREWPKTV